MQYRHWFQTSAFLLTALLLSVTASSQFQGRGRSAYVAHLKDEAYRDAHTMVRASQSLLELYQSREDSRINGKEFDRHSGQRLDLILRSTRHLSQNPLIQRLDRVKKSEKRKDQEDVLEASATSDVLQAIHVHTRNIRDQLGQLTAEEAESLSGDSPDGASVTIGQLQTPRISDLCRTIRASTRMVAKRFKNGTP